MACHCLSCVSNRCISLNFRHLCETVHCLSTALRYEPDDERCEAFWLVWPAEALRSRKCVSGPADSAALALEVGKNRGLKGRVLNLGGF